MGIKHCSELPSLSDEYIAIIDGNVAKTSEEFFLCIWEQLRFPYPQYRNWDGYVDWMRDLSWIKEDKIAIIIFNYDKFLENDKEKRRFFSFDLNEVVFSYWAETTENKKEITVYCIKGQPLFKNNRSTSDIVWNVKKNILNGAKVPHQVSQPVLKMHNDNLCFGFFVFFYNRSDLVSKKIPRPSMWATVDIKTGEIIQTLSCEVVDFSDATYNRRYDISSDGITPISRVEWEQIYTLMDAVRAELFVTGRINDRLYGQYLDKILFSIPEDFRRFYLDLGF